MLLVVVVVVVVVRVVVLVVVVEVVVSVFCCDIFSYTVLKKSTFYDFSEASFLDFKIFTAFCSYRPRSS